MVGGGQRQGAARWRERLDRWKRSGLTITAFCQREGVSQPSFYSWRKRLAVIGRPKPASEGRPKTGQGGRSVRKS